MANIPHLSVLGQIILQDLLHKVMFQPYLPTRCRFSLSLLTALATTLQAFPTL